MVDYTKPIAETKNFIILDRYTNNWQVCESIQSYQSENDLEQEFIRDLQNQGYEYLPGLNTSKKMLANMRVQLQTLNNVRPRNPYLFKCFESSIKSRLELIFRE